MLSEYPEYCHVGQNMSADSGTFTCISMGDLFSGVHPFLCALKSFARLTCKVYFGLILSHIPEEDSSQS